MFRRDLIAQIGDLDERYFLFCEEADLSERAVARGYPTFFLPAVSTVHLGSHSTRQAIETKLEWHYRSKVLFFSKHRTTASAIGLRAFFTIELTVKLALRLMASAVRSRQDNLRRARAYAKTLGHLMTPGAAAR